MANHSRNPFARNPFKDRAAWWPCAALATSCLSPLGCKQSGLAPEGTLWGREYQGWLNHHCLTIALGKPRARQKVLSKSCKRTESQLGSPPISNFVSYLNMNLNFHIYKMHMKSQTFTKESGWHCNKECGLCSHGLSSNPDCS